MQIVNMKQQRKNNTQTMKWAEVGDKYWLCHQSGRVSPVCLVHRILFSVYNEEGFVVLGVCLKCQKNCLSENIIRHCCISMCAGNLTGMTEPRGEGSQLAAGVRWSPPAHGLSVALAVQPLLSLDPCSSLMCCTTHLEKTVQYLTRETPICLGIKMKSKSNSMSCLGKRGTNERGN